MARAALHDAAEYFAVVFEGLEVWGGIEGWLYSVGYCVSANSG